MPINSRILVPDRRLILPESATGFLTIHRGDGAELARVAMGIMKSVKTCSAWSPSTKQKVQPLYSGPGLPRMPRSTIRLFLAIGTRSMLLNIPVRATVEGLAYWSIVSIFCLAKRCGSAK